MSKDRQDRPDPARPGGAFKSFDALRRAAGGGDAPQKPAKKPEEERGWTFVGGDGGAVVGDGGPAAISSDFGSRDRIARRPAGWGGMLHGPPMYLEEDSEEMQLLASFRVRTRFPADVLAEVEHLPRDPRPEDLAGRLDLREETIFTIDGEDARDYDDAISIRALDGGRFQVGVHIADVGHYVQPGTALDAEALARATSIYLPDQVVPMLPEELSNHLCSLVQGRDRLSYSVLMVFDAKGARVEARVQKSVIRSVRRCTYREVQELLDGAATPLAAELAFLEEPLRLFQQWTVRQQGLREAKGSLSLPSREKKFLFDERHEVREVVNAPRYFSMSLIEETALAANQAVGDLFRERGLPTIYRVHKAKDPEEIEAVAKMLEEHKIRVPDKDRLTARDIGRMIRAARKRPNAEALIARIMGLVERAVYEVHDHEDVASHFGLARKAYLHFTSPIRRYPDLMVHRWLWAVESRSEGAEAELRTEELLQDLNEVAGHCSAQAEVADMVSAAVGDLKVCQLMHPHIGEKLRARVLRVSPPGIEVDLQDFNVAGFMPVRSLGQRAQVQGPTIVIQAGRKRLSFTEGHPIAVRLKDVDFIRLQLLLELA